MYQYPYGNAQQLNLDWILNKLKELESGSGSGGADLEEVANALIALTYEEQNYNLSDIVFHEGKLYSANQNITAEPWNPDHWNEVLLANPVSNLVRYVSALNNSQVYNTSNVAGTHTSDALNNLASDISDLNDAVDAINVPDFAVPTRSWNSVKNQQEFEEYLSKFNDGEVSWNCYFDAAGTYKIKLPDNESRLVFTSIQAHMVARTDGVILDLNNCVFYTSHLQFTGVEKTLGTEPTYKIVNSNTDGVPYFEGCTLLLNYCEVASILRLWSDYTTASSCWFVNDLYNPSIYDSCVDVIQGQYYSNNCYYKPDYNQITGSFAIFGVGNSPKICLSGRTGITDCPEGSTNKYLFRNRQNKNNFEVYATSSWYNIERGGSYNANPGHYHCIVDTNFAPTYFFKNETDFNQYRKMFVNTDAYIANILIASNQSVNLVNAKVNTEEVFFKAGDTLTQGAGIISSGICTNGSDTIYLEMPLPKRIDKVTNIAVTVFSGTLRNNTGGYIEAQSAIDYAGDPTKYTITVARVHGMMLRIDIKKLTGAFINASDGTTVTNNSVISYFGGFTITFS